MQNTPEQIMNMSTHEKLLWFLDTDILLNEFLWRADRSNGRLKFDIESALRMNGYNNIKVRTNVKHTNIYINVFENNIKVWHISFHLDKPVQPTSPGAIHIGDNSPQLTATYPYQLIAIVETVSACDPTKINHIQLVQSSYYPTGITSICGNIEPTVKIAINVLNKYFNQIHEPLSLYHNLSGRSGYHQYLMPIIRSRPTNIQRTTLTAHLKGGTHKSIHARRSRKRAYNNRAIKKYVQTYKRINRKSR